MHHRLANARGVTLIDTIVGIALMVLVFVGIASVFVLSVDVVTNNKAQIGAVALANEEMEYMRSLSYASVGTVGGIPAGSVPQDETVSLNNIDYQRHVFVEYADLPQDGTGDADENHVTADVKMAKVSITWQNHGASRTISLTTMFAPPGFESTVPGGTLAITVENAALAPLPGASVHITNASATPAIDVTTTTNADGLVSLIGAPAGSGYHVVVTSPGYSTAQTYTATATLTNPSPGDLTVADDQTTGATFAIDAVGTFAISTWKAITTDDWTDAFSDDSQVATSSGISIAGGEAVLADGATDGSLRSVAIAPAYLARWKSVSFNEATSSDALIRYHVYAGGAPVPDAALPGNAQGFAASPIDISALATSTYPSLALAADLSGTASDTPALSSWDVAYDEGPEPLPDIPYTLTGSKTIGKDADGDLVYKYETAGTTAGSGSVTLPSMEWDTYALAIGSSSYDVAESCPPSPETLLPGENLAVQIYLAPHTANSLLAWVRGSDGSGIANAAVTLSRTGWSESATTDSCGQAFFPGLVSGSAYTFAAAAAGYQVSTTSNVTVTGASQLSVLLSQN